MVPDEHHEPTDAESDAERRSGIAIPEDGSLRESSAPTPEGAELAEVRPRSSLAELPPLSLDLLRDWERDRIDDYQLLGLKRYDPQAVPVALELIATRVQTRRREIEGFRRAPDVVRQNLATGVLEQGMLERLAARFASEEARTAYHEELGMSAVAQAIRALSQDDTELDDGENEKLALIARRFGLGPTHVSRALDAVNDDRKRHELPPIVRVAGRKTWSPPLRGRFRRHEPSSLEELHAAMVAEPDDAKELVLSQRLEWFLEQQREVVLMREAAEVRETLRDRPGLVPWVFVWRTGYTKIHPSGGRAPCATVEELVAACDGDPQALLPLFTSGELRVWLELVLRDARLAALATPKGERLEEQARWWLYVAGEPALLVAGGPDGGFKTADELRDFALSSKAAYDATLETIGSGAMATWLGALAARGRGKTANAATIAARSDESADARLDALLTSLGAAGIPVFAPAVESAPGVVLGSAEDVRRAAVHDREALVASLRDGRLGRWVRRSPPGAANKIIGVVESFDEQTKPSSERLGRVLAWAFDAPALMLASREITTLAQLFEAYEEHPAEVAAAYDDRTLTDWLTFAPIDTLTRGRGWEDPQAAPTSAKLQRLLWKLGYRGLRIGPAVAQKAEDVRQLADKEPDALAQITWQGLLGEWLALLGSPQARAIAALLEKAGGDPWETALLPSRIAEVFGAHPPRVAIEPTEIEVDGIAPGERRDVTVLVRHLGKRGVVVLQPERLELEEASIVVAGAQHGPRRLGPGEWAEIRTGIVIPPETPPGVLRGRLVFRTSHGSGNRLEIPIVVRQRASVLRMTTEILVHVMVAASFATASRFFLGLLVDGWLRRGLRVTRPEDLSYLETCAIGIPTGIAALLLLGSVGSRLRSVGKQRRFWPWMLLGATVLLGLCATSWLGRWGFWLAASFESVAAGLGKMALPHSASTLPVLFGWAALGASVGCVSGVHDAVSRHFDGVRGVAAALTLAAGLLAFAFMT